MFHMSTEDQILKQYIIFYHLGTIHMATANGINTRKSLLSHLSLELGHNYQISNTNLNVSEAADQESQNVLMLWNTISSLLVTSRRIHVFLHQQLLRK